MIEPRSVLSCTAREDRQIPIEQITHFKADTKYVMAYYPGGELLLDDPLCDIEAEFGSRFIRTHRACLVAKEMVKTLYRNLGRGTFSMTVAGVDGLLPVSRRGARTVRDAIPEVQSKVAAR